MKPNMHATLIQDTSDVDQEKDGYIQAYASS